MPKIPEGLALDGLQQFLIRKVLDDSDCFNGLARPNIVFVELGLSKRLRRIDGKRRWPETLGREDEDHQ
jgi:hypothetical protein